MKKRTAALIASFALVVVPVGFAQTPGDTQYGNVAGEVSEEQPQPVEVAGVAEVVETDTLPFTGAGLGLALLAGVGAVAGGLGLRRLGRSSTDR